MAFRILKDNYYIQSVQLPLGVSGQQNYGLRYDPSSGDYVLSQKSAAGYTVGVGLATLFVNGSWTSDALKDPKLFVDSDPNRPTQLAKDLAIDMNKKSYAAFQSLGGSAKGNVINDAARPQNQNNFSVNNAAAGTNPGISSAMPGIGALSNLFEPGLQGIANLDFSSTNEKTLFGDKELLLYPRDILENQQDTLQISMYNYKAPLGDTFIQRDAQGNIIPVNTADIIKKGLQRNSALKDFIGTVILPIPSGIQDNNNISWGDDQMNNLSTAAAAYIIGNTGQAAAGQAAVAAGGAASSALGVPLPTQGINNIATLLAAGASPNNPMFKTAVVSLLLKNAGFDIPPETILARGAGIVPNSNLELLFQGPTLRQFGFNWRMSPRNELEAKNVKRIIRFFKQGSAPRKVGSKAGAGANSFFLGTPNVFKLSYKTAGKKEISGLNKFKICALVGMNVVYAPDGQWAAYDEGQPVSVTMTLNFQEIEPVYESDYQTDVSSDVKGKYANVDYSSVKPEDVGY